MSGAETGDRSGGTEMLAGRKTGLPMGGFARGKSGGRRRITGGTGHANSFHVMSKTAGGEKLFGAVEKDAFLGIVRLLEGFSGVEIVTHAVMANHFHLLVRVPDQKKFLVQFDGPEGEERMFERLGFLYSAEYLQGLGGELADLRARGMEKEADELLNRFKLRFCNLPLFVKELKERFSRWFNRTHDRKGTLWMERFKSVLVADGEALRTMACYIDLNAVRAGLVEDPKDYRWCGYAEALAGSGMARRGLCLATEREADSWDSIQSGDVDGRLSVAMLYRSWLFERGVVTETRRGVTAEARAEVRQKRGGLSRGELLRCRVRYFVDGVAIGGREFVEAVFREQRGNFGKTRKDGAREIREAPGLGLFTLRNLKRQAITGGGVPPAEDAAS